MDRSAPARRRSRPGCPCLREARPEDTQGARTGHNRTVRAPADAVLPVPLMLLEADRHHTAEPGAAWTPDKPVGAEPIGLLHRERSGAEHVPIGTADDGALHQVQESLPQEPRRATAHLTTKATLRDQRNDPPGGTPAPPG